MESQTSIGFSERGWLFFVRNYFFVFDTPEGDQSHFSLCSAQRSESSVREVKLHLLVALIFPLQIPCLCAFFVTYLKLFKCLIHYS